MDHIDWTYFQTLCADLPVVNESGYIVKSYKEKLVLASISKWEKLFGSNPRVEHEFVTLSRDYLKLPTYAYGLEGGEDIEPFIRNELGAIDIPFLRPPDVSLPGFSYSLDKEKVILLLE